MRPNPLPAALLATAAVLLMLLAIVIPGTRAFVLLEGASAGCAFACGWRLGRRDRKAARLRDDPYDGLGRTGQQPARGIDALFDPDGDRRWRGL